MRFFLHRGSKYHAKKSGGYDSKKERRRAMELHLMEQQGMISDLKEQVSFVLIPTQRDAEGKLIERPCVYVADFVYKDEDGKTVVEDVKGYKTPVYCIKRKLMLKVYSIRIKEV